MIHQGGRQEMIKGKCICAWGGLHDTILGKCIYAWGGLHDTIVEKCIYAWGGLRDMKQESEAKGAPWYHKNKCNREGAIGK